MAPRTLFLLLVGFVGTLCIIMISFTQRNISQEKRAERIRQMQDQRKQLLKEMCDGDKEAFSNGKHSLRDMSDNELKHFVVDENHGIIYCYVPKVACTNWKRVMYVLILGEPYDDPMSIDKDLVHLPRVFTLLNSFPRAEREAKLKHYTKFLFVRDPLIRLISAFRDKFLKVDQYFYENFGRYILRRYGNQPDPPQTAEEAFALGMQPSFNNFIQYLVDPKREKEGPFEPHWRQMHKLCHPCLIQYDFIGHQETLQDDAELLLKILKLENDIKFPPSYENMTSRDHVSNWFRTVPLEDRRKLYKLYKDDFRLFGYQKPNELFSFIWPNKPNKTRS